MVKVRQDHPVKADGSVDIPLWIERLESIIELSIEDKNVLQKAAKVSLQAEDVAIASENIWSEGTSSFRTGLEMAEILAELQLDAPTLVAAVLYRAVREGQTTLDRIQDQFGEEVSKLIDGVLRMAAISTLRNDSSDMVFGRQSDEQVENVRRMLVAIVDDVRIALIKLAERTCAIRAVKEAPEAKKQRVAKEVSDVYAPLAHRLGIGHIKWELEDLSFRYLYAEDYKHIASLLDEKRLDRQTYIEDVINILHQKLGEDNISARIGGRAKHIYSIWRKMCRKGIGFSEVYDIRAVRILVNTVQDCYGVLGIVHGLWRNIPHEFDDYIASPKENGYRSLHTALVGPDNKTLEVQIRTQSMHEEAEYGVCAHWRYKGTDDSTGQDSYENKISWLRAVLEWHEEVGGNPLEDDLVSGVEQDRLYVFTPDGHVIDLPSRATPVDFAYRIHTDVGHRCRGAKVNGRIVPLNHQLKTSDQVEIIVGKREAPSRDWLSVALGYVNTSRARAKVHSWFKLQARDQNVADGRAILDREFKRLDLMDLDFERLAKKLNLRSLEDLYVAVGASDVGVNHVIRAAQKLIKPTHDSALICDFKHDVSLQPSSSDVYIDGVGNLMTQISRCCNPLPGDSISGYITTGKGVAIHRQDCSQILQLQVDEPERIIRVEWGRAPDSIYLAEVVVEAYDRQGLLKDVTALLDVERINVTAMQTLSDKGQNTVDMAFTVEVRGFSQLSRLLAKLNQLPNIASARRRRV